MTMTCSGSKASGLLLGGMLAITAVGAWGAEAGIPSRALNCRLTAPPRDAGAYVTPGGFLLVHPRNASLPRDYTGCKSIWVMDSPDHMPLYLRLYFERGRLRLARTFGRDGAPAGTCDLRSPGSSCTGIEDSELVALHLPTWPRICAETADLPACQREPD